MRHRLTSRGYPRRTFVVVGLLAALLAFEATAVAADSPKPFDYTTVTGLSKVTYTSDQIVRDVL
jgi:hypothetical protein